MSNGDVSREVYGLFTLKESDYFFDLCHCSMKTINWILYEPI